MAEHGPEVVDTMVTHRPDRGTPRLSIDIGIFDERRALQERNVIFRNTVVKGAGDYRRQIPIERDQFWISRSGEIGACFDDLARIESPHRKCIVAPISEAKALVLVSAARSAVSIVKITPGTVEPTSGASVAFPDPSLLIFENSSPTFAASATPIGLAEGQRSSRRLGSMFEP